MKKARKGRFGSVLFLLATIGASPIAGAAAIPSYTATDLGVGYAKFSKATGEDATMTAPDGRTVYAFPRTDNEVRDPHSLLASFPPFTGAPVNDPRTYGNPAFAIDSFSQANVFLNQSGVFVATEEWGVSGHFLQGYLNTASRQNAGTFGPLKIVPNSTSPYDFDGYTSVVDLNNRGQLLGISTSGPMDRSGIVKLFDLNTGRATPFGDIYSSRDFTIGSYYPMYLDDQGRILAYGDGRSTGTHTLLLTPAGVSSAPIATPEPTALATLAAAAMCLIIRRRLVRGA